MLIIFCIFFNEVFAQETQPSNAKKNNIKLNKIAIPKGFSLVEGGIVSCPSDYFLSAITDSAQVGNFLLNSNNKTDAVITDPYPAQKLAVGPSLLSKTEVTNKDYRAFLHWVIDSIGLRAMAEQDPSYYLNPALKTLNWSRRKEVMFHVLDLKSRFHQELIHALCFDQELRNGSGSIGINPAKLIYHTQSNTQSVSVYPDTLVWIRDLPYAYNDPLTRHYFSNPAYEDYPVVGINWYQAKAYCDWLSRNSVYRFRLPTFSEYMSAYTDRKTKLTTSNNPTEAVFPWGHAELVDRNGNHLANFGAVTDIFGFQYKSFREVGPKNITGMYTTKVGSFPPTTYGLYDIAGNVAEWTEDGFSDQYTFQKPPTDGKVSELFTIRLNENSKDLEKKMKEFFTDNAGNTEIYVSQFGFKNATIAQKINGDLQILAKLTNPRSVVGGSFIESPQFLRNGVIRAYSANAAHPHIGFRIAADVIWD